MSPRGYKLFECLNKKWFPLLRLSSSAFADSSELMVFCVLDWYVDCLTKVEIPFKDANDYFKGSW